MKKTIAFYTVDLFPGREYLMPWRTILEVAKRIKNDDYNTIILNACYNKNDRHDYYWDGINIKAIKPGYHNLCTFISEENIDVLFIEIKWRDGLKNWNELSSLNCKKIAYFSGGAYSLRNSLKLLSISNLSLAKPCLIESIIPKSILAFKLKKANFKATIGLTDYTSKQAFKSGIENTITIYPGKDEFEKIEPDYDIIKKYQLENKKFLLFTGAPIAFRGSSELIKAVDKSALKDLHLVMLMRLDKGTQSKEFLLALNLMKHRDRVTIIDERLSRAQLKAFFTKAFYAVLPFIVIPSEIPLTYYEIMSCGTPIISFKNGGTTQYLENGLLLSKLGVLNLKSTIECSWNNINLREIKSQNALEIIRKHPDWNEVSNNWKELI